MSGTDAAESSAHRAPERNARAISATAERETREKTLDKTVADSFPASDPPSSLPDPSADSYEALLWCSSRVRIAWGFGGREGARTPDLLVANDKLAVQDVHKVLSVQQNAFSGHKLLRAFCLAHWTP
jgi:hypothetical protein